MKKGLFLLALPAIALILIFLTKKPEKMPDLQLPSPTSYPTDPRVTETVVIKANFEIYTFGTKRIFTDIKYHDLSGEVYINAADPSLVIVNKNGITWADFFGTLPMKLDKDCLTTGTKQVFCSNANNKLRFYINETEDPDALDKEIKEGDKLKVIFN